MPRVWTAAMDRRLAALYPAVGPAGASRELGVSYAAAQTRASRALRLPPFRNRPRYGPDADVLRAEYGRTPTADLARRLGRTVGSVHQFAKRLCLTRPRIVWTPDRDARLVALHGAGLLDGAIGRELGCDRHTVAKRRAELGLPYNAESRLDAGRRAAATQLRRMGLSSPAELRARRLSSIPLRYGLPAHLKVRQVQILLCLASGPMTRRQLVGAMGLTWNAKNHGRANLKDQNTSHVGALVARGLVVSARVSGGAGSGRGTHHCLYSLTPEAIDLMSSAKRPSTAEATSCPA